jgi:hypothetical protein
VKVGDLIRYKKDFGPGGLSTAPWSAPCVVVKLDDRSDLGRPELLVFRERLFTVNTIWNAIQYRDREDDTWNRLDTWSDAF